MYEENGGAIMLKKALRSGLTYCIACKDKGSSECKWSCVQKNESNKYQWVQRIKGKSESLFPTCEKKHFMEDLITV